LVGLGAGITFDLKLHELFIHIKPMSKRVNKG
jgi:hypothetical protein